MIFLPILRSTLGLNSARSRRAPPPSGPPESFIFLWNFNDFPPHTEVYSRLQFCAPAPWLTPQDLWNPSFSYGISMIFLPILRSTLGSNSAASRRGSPPRT